MTDKPRYPNITDASLIPFRALEAMLKTYPDLFTRPECPYPPAIRAFLAKMLASGSPPVEQGPFQDDDLVTETSRLYREIQTSLQTMENVDAKDRATIFKTSTDLLGKLVAMREKSMNMREMSRFQKTVIEVLESVLTPAQRSEFVEKLSDVL